MEKISYDKNNLTYIYCKKFFTKKEAATLFEDLAKVKFNSDEESKIVIYGKSISIPRKQVAFGDPSTSYTFSGNTVKGKKWPDFLVTIREKIEKYLIEEKVIKKTEKINFVLVNYYADGSKYIGKHSDDEKDLVPGKPIVSVSVGAERDFVFSSKEDPTIKETIKLENRSLLLMMGKTQKYWKHEVPKRLKIKEGRYNLTFRFMV